MSNLNAATRLKAAKPNDTDWESHELLIALDRIESFCKDARSALIKGRVEFAQQQMINIANVAKSAS
jgi:Flp pilus assembly protein TadD